MTIVATGSLGHTSALICITKDHCNIRWLASFDQEPYRDSIRRASKMLFYEPSLDSVHLDFSEASFTLTREQ